MNLWRISNSATLNGLGGTLQSARWHTKGRAIVYTADHPASAPLEMLANLDVGLLPDTFRLLKISVPDEIAPETVMAVSNWLDDISLSRAVGDQWLRDGRSLLLQVPSAILPDVFNILINPLHPDAQRLKIEDVQSVPLDQRLR